MKISLNESITSIALLPFSTFEAAIPTKTENIIAGNIEFFWMISTKLVGNILVIISAILNSVIDPSHTTSSNTNPTPGLTINVKSEVIKNVKFKFYPSKNMHVFIFVF